MRAPGFKSLQRVHRVAYKLWCGEIAAGLEIDHLCRVRSCCNPQHLEAVTPQENNRRSESRSAKNARKTECSNKHPYTEDSTYNRPDGGRNCRICDKNYQKKKRDNT